MRWVTREGDGTTVREILARAGADPRAVDDGRVFVGRRRVRQANEPLRAGDVVDIVLPRAEKHVNARPHVLARESDFVGVDKPAGLPTIPDHGGAAHALISLVANDLGLAPSNLHATSRLDRDVSGVVVFALDGAAAARFTEARSQGRYERRYVAIAARAPNASRGTEGADLGHLGPVAVSQGVWEFPIGRAPDPRLRVVNGRDATHATTRFAVVARTLSGQALLAVAPITGRTHQIRVHAAHAGAPLVGDRAYGGPTRITLAGGRVIEPRRVALHAARVRVPDARGVLREVTAPVPVELCSLWAALGGDADAWEAALSCELSSS